MIETKETIAEHFREIGSCSTQRILELLSDGEIQFSSIKDFHHWDELTEATKDTIEAKGSVAFSGRRRACADVMDSVMQRLWKDHHLRAPRCWLIVIHKLRNDDGLVSVQPREVQHSADKKRSWCRLRPTGSLEVEPEGILREPFSPFNAVCEDPDGLADLEPILIERARQHGVPAGWEDAVRWVADLLSERPEISERLRPLRDALADRLEGSRCSLF